MCLIFDISEHCGFRDRHLGRSLDAVTTSNKAVVLNIWDQRTPERLFFFSIPEECGDRT